MLRRKYLSCTCYGSMYSLDLLQVVLSEDKSAIIGLNVDKDEFSLQPQIWSMFPGQGNVSKQCSLIIPLTIPVESENEQYYKVLQHT